MTAPLAPAAHHFAEREAQRRRDQQDCQHLQEIGQRRGVFVGVRGIGIEEPASVGAQQLDGLLRGYGAHGQGLGAGERRFGQGLALRVEHGPALRIHARLFIVRRFHQGHFEIGAGVLDHALAHQRQGQRQRQGQQHV